MAQSDAVTAAMAQSDPRTADGTQQARLTPGLLRLGSLRVRPGMIWLGGGRSDRHHPVEHHLERHCMCALSVVIEEVAVAAPAIVVELDQMVAVIAAHGHA